MAVEWSAKRSDFVLSLLVVMWVASTAAMTTARTVGLAPLNGVGQILALSFIIVLVVWLWRTQNIQPPPVGARHIFDTARFRFASALAAILLLIGLLFVVALVAHPWLVFIAALTAMALWQIALLWRDITVQMAAVGLALSAVCLKLSFAAGRLDGFQAFYLLCIPFLFVGGSLLAGATGLIRVHIAQGHWAKAAKGVMIGCVLALPAALLNVSFGAHTGDGWVNQVWEPALALIPGIAEETWARLALLTLVFAVLQPTSPDRPTRAILAAVLIAAFVHALAHLPAELVFSPAAFQMSVSALLFGVPMGLLFVRLGFEYAVGYHAFIDFVRFGVAFAAN